jgi:hypothetical protein
VKRLGLILVFLTGVLSGIGCKKTPTEPSINTDLNIACKNLRPLRSGEHYVLWLKYTGDDTWHLMDTVSTSYIFPNGYINNLFHHTDIPSVAGVSETVVSIETSLPPTHPTLTLLHGSFIQTDTGAVASISTATLGDFSSLAGSIVFPSAIVPSINDSEFYLCSFSNASYHPSLANLPALPAGWKYGLWAIDSSFFPIQRIFYGTFTKAAGHDDDSVSDRLPFPGGAKPAAMNQRTGRIIVTLEPDLYSPSVLVANGPAQFTVLGFDRQRSITRDSNYAMRNVSAGLPFGTVKIVAK